jgi:predicted ATPase
MKLKTVQIRDFRSIRDSHSFEIDDITCLVGKNESGKTAILEGLYRLNPVISSEGNYDVTDDYPRLNVEDYQQDVEKGVRKPAIVVEAVFQLEAEDIQPIKEAFGDKALNNTELSLSKGYENKLYVGVPGNEQEALKMIISKNLTSDTIGSIPACATAEELLNFLNSKEAAGETTAVKELLKKIKTSGFSMYVWEVFLNSRVPKFFYYDEFYQMDGHVNIETLKQRNATPSQSGLLKSDHPMLGLISLSRLSLDELVNPQRTEWLINKLEGASNHLSKKALLYWSQNKFLQMKFDVRPARPGDPQGMQTGTNLWARVEDTKHKVSTPLGSRSRGFVWFFSFLAWFSKLQKRNEPLILLLDEPGLFLHATAQADLLRFIESELNAHQVIYTTHSPFMVDPKHFKRVRIVEDKSLSSDEQLAVEEQGTKVTTDVLEVGEASLFPLQAALGYEISQTLFIGPNNLIVEGVSDLLYLQSMSGLLQSKGREGLNAAWTITPVGGADKVPTFVALIGAQRDMNLATLIDIQNRDRQSIENLYKKKLLKQSHVLTFAEFTKTSEADIEDMFEPAFYLQLVNAEFKSDLASPIKAGNLDPKAPRILARLQKFFSATPLKGKASFNHYRPARYFAENISALQGTIVPQTLDSFETAFKALNALL